MSTTDHVYEAGEIVLFEDVPALILEVHENGILLISEFPGMSAYIGTQHSKLAPMTERPGPAFARRIAELRAYKWRN